MNKGLPIFILPWAPPMTQPILLLVDISCTQQIPDPRGERFLFSCRVTELRPTATFPFGAYIHANAATQLHSRDVVGIIYSSSRGLD